MMGGTGTLTFDYIPVIRIVRWRQRFDCAGSEVRSHRIDTHTSAT